ncbi:MAG: tetratricopeptide repeat protein [candidate division WOR-3 bacterium]
MSLLLILFLATMPSNDYQGIISEFIPYNAYQFLDLIEDGDIQYARGKYAQAESLYQKAYHLSLSKKNYRLAAIALISVGTALGKQAQHQAALNKFQDALTLKQSIYNQDLLSILYYNLAVSYHYLNKIESAINYYNQALALAPNEIKILINRGDAFYDADSFKLALNDYSHALLLDLNNSLAYQRRANLYEQMQEYANALDDYQKAIEHEPENIKLMIKLADLFLLKDDRLSAQFWYRQALASPDTLNDSLKTYLKSQLQKLSKP